MTTCVSLLETVPSLRVTDIQFGLLNPEIVKRQSVVHVTKTTLYVRQLPSFGGLNDLRMGTSDRRLPCGTCKNDVLSCVGHFGHIELAAPMYHVSMINIVVKILRCVCFFCSRLLIDCAHDPRANDSRFQTCDPKDRLNMMVNLCKTKHFCMHCNGPQAKYTQIRASCQIKTEFRAKDKFESEQEFEFASRPFTAAMARAILKFIPDDEVELLGINHVYARPEWLILTILQVPPPISRPSIMATDGSRARGQDDITLKLQEIIKTNLVLETAISTAGTGTQPFFMRPLTPAIKNAWEVLQQHLVQFMHHDSLTGAPAATGNGSQRSNRPLRLVPARLKGKKGRFRGTLGGKRVDYSARTVVSPAPTYDIHEVGVPRIIAQHLTYPERVNDRNMAELQQRVKNGPDHLFGAAGVVMHDGTLLDLTLYKEQHKSHDFKLQTGWVVERYLRDGDWVLFNRQPSLHRMSIMAHQVRIIQDKTFRLPVCDTTPYNADFDGDEMNLHVLRTVEAVAEAQELMCVRTQLISPQSNKPIIGLVQDSLVSVMLLTERDTFLTREQIMQMVMPIKYPLFADLPPPAVLKPRPLWTGKQLFSLLLPVFSLQMVVRSGTADGVELEKDGVLDMQERCVVIRRGVLCAGSLCKKTMGTSAGGIIHVLVKDFGNNVAANFISDAQRILVEFMQVRGFSVGIGDCMMPRDTHDKVNASINRCLAYGDKLLAGASRSDKLPVLMEGCMTKLMTGVLNRAGAVVQQDLSPTNNVLTMVQSGAKGSAVNIAQILGCVGQQSVEGGRIARDVNNRTLPCYARGDTTAESRGFVANSYGTGLTAQEYFFHAMGGREGLVDTAVKTASTGYIQRRLVKAEEGLQVRYDHTVRNTKDQIVQFYYGGDSFDAVYVEKQTLRTFTLSNQQLRDEYAFTWPELQGCSAAPAESWPQWEAALRREVRQLRADRDVMRAAKCKLNNAPDATVFVTICVKRLLGTAVTRFGVARGAVTDAVRPGQVTCLMRTAYSKIGAMRRGTATFTTLAYLRSLLGLRTLLLVHRLPVAAVAWCAEQVVHMYRKSLTAPGEMVGTLGAASIGEPCTQMTLNTFHTAGVAEKAVTLGVPRLKELIDTSRNIKTPSASIFFEHPYNTNEKMSAAFAVALQYTLLNRVVLTSSVQLDSDMWATTIVEDRPFVDAYSMLYRECRQTPPPVYTKWLIRFVLDREVLASIHLDVQHVASALQAYMGDTAQIMCSEVNMLNWCIRLRIDDLDALLSDMDSVIDEEERSQLEYASLKTIHDFLLDNMPVHGVPSLVRVMAHQQDVAQVGADEQLVRVKEWMADTDGTNLRALLGVQFVDKCRTISNDIHEVLDVLGIEAAQHVLMDEIRAVLSFDGAYVNERHLQLLADVMTLSGTLTAMTRHSMHKLGGSTYHHASFEETQDVLINAAAFGTHDKISGVTENLMMGMLMPGGTGCCDIIAAPLLPADDGDGSSDGESAVQVLPMQLALPMMVEPMVDASDAGGSANVCVAPLALGALHDQHVAPLRRSATTVSAHPANRHRAHFTTSTTAFTAVPATTNSRTGVIHSTTDYTNTGGTQNRRATNSTNYIHSTARSLLQFVPLSPSNITITKEFRPLSPCNI